MHKPQFRLGLIRFSFILIIICLHSRLVWSQSKDFSHPISPVYEELLGNQIFLLWEELIQKKEFKQNEPFFIAGWKEAEALLASRILSAAKKRYKHELDHWQSGLAQDWETREDLSSQGVILLDLKDNQEVPAKDLQKLAELINRKDEGFLIVFIDQSTNYEWLKSLFWEAGLKVQTIFESFEIEFVKDNSGRQVIDLDGPYYRNLIYENLVYKGMNPVGARHQADEAVRNFRKTRDSKIIILGKARS